MYTFKTINLKLTTTLDRAITQNGYKYKIGRDYVRTPISRNK